MNDLKEKALKELKALKAIQSLYLNGTKGEEQARIEELETALRLWGEKADHITKKAESYERCQEDGFLSQWASGVNANLADEKAKIAYNGGKAEFQGLYQGDRRVKAKEVVVDDKYCGGQKSIWLVHEDEQANGLPKWIPYGPRSRKQKQFGLCQKTEMDYAWAKTHSTGYGLAGCASVRVIKVRDYKRADEWGATATLVKQD